MGLARPLPLSHERFEGEDHFVVHLGLPIEDGLQDLPEDPTESLELNLDLHGFGTARVIDHQVMTNADLRAVNSLKQQNAVAPKAGSGLAVDGGTLTGKLAPYSYQLIRLQLS